MCNCPELAETHQPGAPRSVVTSEILAVNEGRVGGTLYRDLGPGRIQYLRDAIQLLDDLGMDLLRFHQGGQEVKIALRRWPAGVFQQWYQELVACFHAYQSHVIPKQLGRRRNMIGKPPFDRVLHQRKVYKALDGVGMQKIVFDLVAPPAQYDHFQACSLFANVVDVVAVKKA